MTANSNGRALVTAAIRSEEDYQKSQLRIWKTVKTLAKQMYKSNFPEGTKIYLSYGHITIRVPWGVANLSAARRAMGDGWKFNSNYTETNGTLTKSYHKYGPENDLGQRDYVSLSLIMDSSALDPNTCKRIEVGEKTYTQKVYQIICEDGVKEMLGQAEEVE